MILWKKNRLFMVTKLSIFVIVVSSLSLSSCISRNERYSDGTVMREKWMSLKTFSFIYDIQCVDMASRERADTTFMTALYGRNKEDPYIMYVVTGDCSYCIGTALDFIQVCMSAGMERYHPYIAIINNPELFKYYLREDGLDEVFRGSDMILLPEGLEVPDGMYLIYKNRILNYAEWEI